MKIMKACFSAIVGLFLMANVANAAATPEAQKYDECAATVFANVAGPGVTLKQYEQVIQEHCGLHLIMALLSLEIEPEDSVVRYVVLHSIAVNAIVLSEFLGEQWYLCEDSLREEASDDRVQISM